MLDPCTKCEGKKTVGNERGFAVACDRCGGNGREPTNPADVENSGKRGKVRPTLVDPDFVLGLARVMEAGLREPGRVPNGWKTHPSDRAVAEYADAMMRHALAAVSDLPRVVVDAKSGEDALLHVATSAMILWYHQHKLADEPLTAETIDEIQGAAEAATYYRPDDGLAEMAVIHALTRRPETLSVLEKVDDDLLPGEIKAAIVALALQGRIAVHHHDDPTKSFAELVA